jgi:hypothetical protein
MSRRDEIVQLRHCERSEAIQTACAGSQIASSLSLLAMTQLGKRK